MLAIAVSNYVTYQTILCHVQVTKSDGQLAAKAIDLDISMFKSSLLSALKHRPYVNGGTCSKDRDCNFNFINCLGECDLTTQSCTGRLKSNNLIVSHICKINGSLKPGSPVGYNFQFVCVYLVHTSGSIVMDKE